MEEQSTYSSIIQAFTVESHQNHENLFVKSQTQDLGKSQTIWLLPHKRQRQTLFQLEP